MKSHNLSTFIENIKDSYLIDIFKLNGTLIDPTGKYILYTTNNNKFYQLTHNFEIINVNNKIIKT